METEVLRVIEMDGRVMDIRVVVCSNGAFTRVRLDGGLRCSSELLVITRRVHIPRSASVLLFNLQKEDAILFETSFETQQTIGKERAHTQR